MLIGKAAARADIKRFGKGGHLVAALAQVQLEAIQIGQCGAVIIFESLQIALEDNDLGGNVCTGVACNRLLCARLPAQFIDLDLRISIKRGADRFQKVLRYGLVQVELAHDGHARLHIGSGSVGIGETLGDLLRFPEISLGL